MKLAPPFALAFIGFAALACTKKPSPEFESEVSSWQQRQCSCYATSQTGTDCSSSAPRAELGEAEHLMVNAGLLTDARRDTVRQAEDVVRSCAKRAADRAHEREQQKLFEATKVDLSRVIPPALAPAARPQKTR